MSGAVEQSVRPVRVLVIGHPSDATAGLRSELEACRPGAAISWCRPLRNLPDAATPPDMAGTRPDIIVVLQEHPERASPRQVRALLNTFPLARLIVSCSPWCDSEGRTRQLWPAACRVPADMLLHRLIHELAVAGGQSPPLPLTADRNENWEYDYAAEAISSGKQLAIALSTPDPTIAEWLSDALPSAGHRVVDPADSSAEVLLVDVDPWTPQRAASLMHWLQSHRDVPVVALAGFSRDTEERMLREAGVRSIASKLAPLPELLRVLEEAAAAPRKLRPTLQIVRDS